MNLGGDLRGQSTVVGATLLLAIAIVGLGITQAFVVPQQNAAVAQNHWEDVQQDMTQLRSVMDRVVDRRSSASVAVRLGQRLPDRPFLVEGVPPHGTLATRGVAITIRGTNYSAPADRSGDGNQIIDPVELNGSSPTKELKYTQSGGDWQTITSVIGPVSTFSKQDGKLSQQVIESGDRIDVLILKGDVSVGGLRTEQVDVEGVSRSCTAIEGTSTDEITVERSGTPDRTIDWNNGDIRTVCLLVVSINNADVPDPPRLTPKTGSTGGSNDTLFNPLTPLRFKCADQRGSSSGDKTIVDMTFENTAGNATDIDRTRIASYQDGESSGGSDIPDRANFTNPSGTVVARLDVAGASEDVSPNVGFNPGQNRTVAYDFSGSNATALDNIIVRFTTGDGRVIRYFVQVKKPGECNHAGTGSGGTSAIVDYVSGSAVADVDGSTNGVQFKLENSGSTDATIQAITVNDTNNSAAIVAETNSGTGEGNREVYIDADTDGDYEAGDSGGSKLQIGDSNKEALTNVSIINSGNQGTFYIYEFQRNNGTPVDMADSQVTVTVFYADGSKDTFTLDVPSP